jgi:UDP-N-acetylmuramoylalanine--D-glutamate ligase
LEFAGVKVVVVGMARSGLAAVKLLTAKGAVVRAVDSKSPEQLPEAAETLKKLGVPFQTQSFEALQDAKWIVLSPGVPADLDLFDQARRSGAKIVGEVELAGLFLKGKIIGITGSNGKTTTTALAGHILKRSGIAAQVGGNIGTTPATALVRSSQPDQWNVLELSSFQLETIDHFRAHIGVALNLTPDHLDRHGTFQHYAAAKARLFENQLPEDIAVLNADDPGCVEYAARTRARVLWFSLTRPVPAGIRLENGRLLFGNQPFLQVSEIPLRGRHNIENVMAAAAASHMAGAPLEKVAAAVTTFPGVEHRLEFVRSVNGVDFYNDSKATNVDSTLKAMDAFQGPLWIILGGKDKGSDYSPLAGPLAAKARAALLIGAATPIIALQLRQSAPIVECGTLEQAVQTAIRDASAGDTVLLAPACASFDQFENFEHRGRVFKDLVANLPETPGGHSVMPATSDGTRD